MLKDHKDLQKFYKAPVREVSLWEAIKITAGIGEVCLYLFYIIILDWVPVFYIIEPPPLQIYCQSFAFFSIE